MKKAFLFLSLFCLGLSASLAQGVLRINGRAVERELSRAVMDGNGNMTIYFSDGTSNEYNMNRVEVIEGEVILGIQELMQHDIYTVRGIVGDDLLIEGLQGDETLLLYTIDGHLVSRQTAEGNDSMVSLKGVPAGNYLLRVNTQLFKFNKQ